MDQAFDGAILPICFGLSIGIFLMGTLTKELPKKEEVKEEPKKVEEPK